MATTTVPAIPLEGRFAHELPELGVEWKGQPVTAPSLVIANEALAAELGLDPAIFTDPAVVDSLAGNTVPPGSTPIAMAYAGHQFGNLNPGLGDGRALLLGEIATPDGGLVDLHLKGSGRTPFSRGGDGRAALGPMLREHLTGEAMHALGIPTTRSLAVIGTGDPVIREQHLPGAVLARVAASHIRVGTFQWVAIKGDRDLLARLVDHAAARHHPAAADHPSGPALGLLDAVLDAQARLVAQWMLVGFVHGVMNTDNTTISGQTIDYGPCAFLDVHDPDAVFSSIDHAGRYAYGNQPHIVRWNLYRLAETLLPLVGEGDDAVEAVTAVLDTFPARFEAAWLDGVRAKLGLAEQDDDDQALAEDLLRLLTEAEADHTRSFRALSSIVRGHRDSGAFAFRRLLHGDATASPDGTSDPTPTPTPSAGAATTDPAGGDSWVERWFERLDRERRDPEAVAAEMDATNPIYIPRNHLVETALDAATTGDLDPFQQLLAAVTDPYREQPGRERYAEGAPPEAAPHVTYCGT